MVESESKPMSEDKKKEIADRLDYPGSSGSNKEFVAYLRNPATVILSPLISISEQEKIDVMNTVCDEWDDDKRTIYFFDANYNFLKSSKNAKELPDKLTKRV
ncbi:MAG: hypothetical protein LBS85_00620 [Clostridiales Family XIII bacterium]|nr:hypothetical protein [Clostridiales Family XIII bacterium]